MKLARSLFLFDVTNPVRQIALDTCTAPWFDSVILFVIVANGFMMALEDPLDKSRDACPRDPCPDDARSMLELLCNLIFTAEMLAKIFSFGFVIGGNTYLRSAWNILDFVIVITAWLPYLISDVAATNALRVMRVLRPLRSVSRFPGLKNLVITIFMAGPQLQLLVIVVCLFFVTFGVVGIQLWKGVFLQRCQEPGASDQCPIWDSTSNSFIPNATQLCPCAYAMNGCEGNFCDLLDGDLNSFGTCPSGEECSLASKNPSYGFVSFDNIAAAWMIVLACVTCNNWQDAMQWSMATTGPTSVIYYAACVLMGAYFLLNLFVAVLKEKFAIATSVMKMSETLFDDVDASGDGLLDKDEIRDVFNSKGVVLSQDELDRLFDEIDDDGSGEIDCEEFQVWMRTDSTLAKQMRARLDVMARAMGAKEGGMTQDVLNIINDPDTPAKEKARLKLTASIAGGVDFEELFAFHDRDESGELNLRQFRMMLRRDAGILPGMMTNDEIEQVFTAVDVDSGGGIDGNEFTDWLYGTLDGEVVTAKGVRGLLFNILRLRHDSIDDMFRRRTLSRKQFAQMLRKDAHHHDEDVFGEDKIQETFDAVHKYNKTPSDAGIDCEEFKSWLYAEEEEEDEAGEEKADPLAVIADAEPISEIEPRNEDELPPWRATLQLVVTTASFSTFFMLLIILNTICLAYDHHGIEKEEERMLEIANLVITLLFTIELLMKLAAYKEEFSKDKFNLFDAFIVVTGLIELTANANSVSAFRVLRMFRLLRMIRLIAFMKPLRAIFRVVMMTTSGMVYIALLVGLFMFVFSVSGMQLFGGNFEFKHQDEPILWHFDTFPIAFMTCFQIMNFDNYDLPMYDGLRSVGWGSVFYFVIWVVLGALVLRNLLLVIILETYVMVSETIRNEEAAEAKRLAEEEAARLEEAEDDDAATTFEDEATAVGTRTTDANTFEDVQKTAPQTTSSCFFFQPDSGFRKGCVKLSDSESFEHVIMGCIFLNCVTMSLETPNMDPDSDLALWLWRFGFLFTLVFTIEATVKMIGYGVAHPVETAYLALGWNRLDFFILIIAWVDVLFAESGVKALKAMRALRAVRILNKIQGLRVLVLALIDALGSLLYVGVLTFMLWLIFGICGVNYLKGKLYQCNDITGAVAGIDSCVGTNVINLDGQYIVVGREWLNTKANFDHIGAAMYTLFEVSMNEWYQIAHSAINSVAENVQPIPGYQQWWTLYFIIFVLLSNLFFMNLFVGVIYEKYFARKYEGLEELSKEQRQYLAVLEMVSSRAFTPERGPLTGTESRFYAIASSQQLENGILAAIVLNCTMMALTYRGEPVWWEQTQFWSNQIFTLIFTAEMIVKILGYTFSQYWVNAWNRFDCFVVVGSWLDLLVTLFEIEFISASLFRIIRIARVIGRIGRLFKGLKLLSGIDAIINTFIGALPALSYIALFIALEIFVFAVVAMNIFGTVQLNGCMNEFRNFQSVPTGMLTLFGMATKDGAVCIIRACMLEEGDSAGTCTEAEGNCGDTVTAKLFFAIYDFTLMVTTIEMFVNIILAKYEEISELESLPVTSHDLNHFRKLWTSYDPSASRWIADVDLEQLLSKLDRHIGYDELAGEETLELGEMRLPDLPDGTKVGYLEGVTNIKQNEPYMSVDVANWDDEKEASEYDNPVAEEGTTTTPQKDATSTFENEAEQNSTMETFDTDEPACNVRYYHFYEILYGLVDRKCGIPLPADNLVCRNARLRMCLRTPSVREAAIAQRKAMAKAAAGKRLERIGAVALEAGSTSRRGALNDYLEDRDAVLDEVQSKMPTSPSAGAGASDGSSAPGGRDSSLDVDVLVNKTDASATRAKTRGTLLTGLRDGSLEKAVAQMEADTSADTVAEEPKL